MMRPSGILEMAHNVFYKEGGWLKGGKDGLSYATLRA